jgi:hypothetical protein
MCRVSCVDIAVFDVVAIVAHGTGGRLQGRRMRV